MQKRWRWEYAVQLRRKQHSIGEIVDRAAERAEEIADAMPEAAAHVASGLAKTSGRVSSHLGQAVHDLGQATHEEAGEFMRHRITNPRGTRRRRHRVRNSLLFGGAGAVTAYFLDPATGRDRREALRRRTSRSAEKVAVGLDLAAHAARQTAEVAAQPAVKDPDPARIGDGE